MNLGRTQTAEWINPVAIAHTGTMKWNDFASHRPDQVGLIASALLGTRDPAEVAVNVWAVLDSDVLLSTVAMSHPPGVRTNQALSAVEARINGD